MSISYEAKSRHEQFAVISALMLMQTEKKMQCNPYSAIYYM